MKQSNFESSKLALEPYLQEPLVFNGLYASLGDWEDVIYRHSKEEEIGFSWKLSGQPVKNLLINPTSGRYSKEMMLYFYESMQEERLIEDIFIDYKDCNIDVKVKNCGIQNQDERIIVSQFIFKNLESNFSFELNNCTPGKYQLKLRKIYLKDLLFRWIYTKELYYYSIFPLDNERINKFRETKTFKEKIIDEVVFENVEVKFEGMLPTLLKINNFAKESQKIIEIIRQQLETNKKFSKYLKEFIKEISERLDSYIKASRKKTSSKKANLREEFPVFSKEKVVSLTQYFGYEITIKNLKELWSSFRYIGPLREAPKRFYLFDDPRGIDIGIKGENTALVLALEQDNKIPQYHRCIYQGKQVEKFELRESDRMLEAVNWWLLECMKLPEIKSVVGLRGTINQVQLNSSGVEVSLPDVGFGVSQILPILVECLRVKEGETIILEQPEIHLHPSLQSKLADFFICMAKSGKNLVIETHSEHLINRLCLRVAQAESTEIQSLLNPLFVSFDEAEQTSVIKKITINEYGEIENWPVGFFDEDDSRELMEATLKKRMTQFKA